MAGGTGAGRLRNILQEPEGRTEAFDIVARERGVATTAIGPNAPTITVTRSCADSRQQQRRSGGGVNIVAGQEQRRRCGRTRPTLRGAESAGRKIDSVKFNGDPVETARKVN